MKKLMVIAAAASLAAAAEAGIVVNTNCAPRNPSCPVVAFKVTASGKIAYPAEKKDDVYKTATKLQIKKGALVIFGTADTAADECCYDNYSLYLNVKIGKNKETIPVGVFFETLDSWSIFGKKYNKALEAEKSKKYSVESEIGMGYVNAGNAMGGASTTQGLGDSVTGAGLSIDLGLQDFAFIATAFGKGTYAFRAGKTTNVCGVCSPGSETYEFTPGNYSGWFAGIIDELGGEYGCLMCNCASLDVFGGTWKAKYDKTWSKNGDGWQKAAAYVFGSDTVADMKANDIE